MIAFLQRIAVGKRLLRPDSLDHADPRLTANLLEQQSKALGAFWMFVFSVALFSITSLWALLDQDSDMPSLAAGVVFGFVGLAGGRWRAEREDRSAQEERIVTLGSVFNQSPEVLRDLLQPQRIDGILVNLLKTVLKDDELGESVWGQGVSPLVDAIGRGSVREQLRYDIQLKSISETIDLGLDDCSALKPDEYDLFETELSYRQRADSLPNELFLGLIFGQGRGLSWFNQKSFVLREYAPFDVEVLSAIGRIDDPSLSKNPSFIRKLGLRLGLAGDSPMAELVERMCAPRLYLGDLELKPKGAFLDRDATGVHGLAIRYELSRDMRRAMLEGDLVEIRAQLSFPAPVALSSFPVHMSELTRGAEVRFDFGASEIETVSADLFFSGHDPFRTGWFRTRPDCLVVASKGNEWLFRGSGVVFSWQRQ